MNPNRYLEIIDAKGERVAVTFAPATGRITLKIPTTASEIERKIYTNMVQKVKEHPATPDLTVRGHIRMVDQKYHLALKLNNYFFQTEE